MKQTKTVSGTIRPEDNNDPFEGTPPAAPTPPPSAPKPSSSEPPPYPIKLVPVPATPPLEDEGDAAAPTAKPEATPEGDATAVEDTSPIPNLAKTDFDNIQSEFGSTGKLSEDSYDKLAKAGYSKTFVDQMISNQVAAVRYTEQQLYSSVGTAQAWEETLVPWAAKNMPIEDRQQLDAELTSGDVKRQAAAIAKVKQLYDDANGKPAAVVLEGRKPGTSPGVKPFSGPEAYQAAISDPRWQARDPEYVERVRSRARASKQAGIRLT
jgi:hypothetical protein